MAVTQIFSGIIAAIQQRIMPNTDVMDEYHGFQTRGGRSKQNVPVFVGVGFKQPVVARPFSDPHDFHTLRVNAVSVGVRNTKGTHAVTNSKGHSLTSRVIL